MYRIEDEDTKLLKMLIRNREEEKNKLVYIYFDDI